MSEIRCITADDVGWPDQLLDLDNPPAALYLLGDGDLAELAAQSVAIVGSREATQYGESVAADMACALSERRFCVVSGGAAGIDATAHRGALAGPTPTVAVLAGGLDRSYPSRNTQLFERIIERGGLVVSQYPPGTVPHRSHFLDRNRIIAALTPGTVVVECGPRGGTVAMAEAVSGLNRVLMAVPGPVTSLMSAGCHNLLRNGARLVVDSAGVIAAIEEWAVDAAWTST